MDEGNSFGWYISNAMARQKEKCFDVIFDVKTRRHIEKDPVDVAGYIQGDTYDIDNLIEKALQKGWGDFVSETLADLAKKQGLLRIDFGKLWMNIIGAARRVMMIFSARIPDILDP